MPNTEFQLTQQAIDAQQAQQRAAALQQCQSLAIAIFVRTIAALSPSLTEEKFMDLCKQSANRSQIAAVLLLKESFGMPLDIKRKEVAPQETTG